MPSVDVSDLTNILECAICLEIVSNPKNLSCDHSYCKKCLDGLLEFAEDGSAIIKCPRGCTQITEVSNIQTTNDISTNYMLRNVLDLVRLTANESHHERTKCELWCTKGIKKYCIYCNIFLCDNCLDKHDSIKGSFIPVNFDVQRNELSLFCEEHATDVSYVCCESKYACVYCLHREHATHKFETLVDAEKSMKVMLDKEIRTYEDIDVQQKQTKEDMLNAKWKLEEVLRRMKFRCINDYVELLNHEEKKIKNDYCLKAQSLLKDINMRDSLKFFKKCLYREGTDFLLQRDEIMSKIKSKTVPQVTVSLTHSHFLDKHPLGSLEVVNGPECSLVTENPFISEINNIEPPSLASVKYLKYMLDKSCEELDLTKGTCDTLKNIDTEFVEHPCLGEGIVRFDVKNISEITGSVLSNPVTIRNCIWKIDLQPTYKKRSGKLIKYAGVYVDYEPAEDHIDLSCQAHAKITLKKHDGDDFTKTFSAKRNFSAEGVSSLGYASFIPWNDITDPIKGYSKNDSITIEASIEADVPLGIFWDSKKITGYVGLKKHKETYLNPVLQSLFLTNKLRKAVYHMPADDDENIANVGIALQRVFYELQHSEETVSTRNLTKTLDWETRFDAVDLCRILLVNNIEVKVKKSEVQEILEEEKTSYLSTMQELLEGKLISYVSCTNVDYGSSREETFYNIQLNKKYNTDLLGSFDEYVKKEILDGDNRYNAGEHGLQVATKCVNFLHFPPVLHLHLLHLQHNQQSYGDVSDIENNNDNDDDDNDDTYSFPETLNLSKYLTVEAREVEPEPIYTLHAVLGESEDQTSTEQHVAYINPKGDGVWYKFNDNIVSHVTKKQAVENNYGGPQGFKNVYMLSYILTSEIEHILCGVVDSEIPELLREQLSNKKIVEHKPWSELARF